VVTALHEYGVEVVAVDHRSQARGVQVARDLDVPVLVGDAHGLRLPLQFHQPARPPDPPAAPDPPVTS